MTANARPARAEQAAPQALQAFDLTQVASHLLRRAHFRAEALFAQAFPDEDLTPRQKALLITVYQNPGATQNRIAELIADRARSRILLALSGGRELSASLLAE